MVQYQIESLDRCFAALSDPTRRGILERLATASASISGLAEQFGMTLTGMKKHVGVLEQAGLVATSKVGRTRTCRLGHQAMKDEAAWIERFRKSWEERFDALDEYLTREKENDDE